MIALNLFQKVQWALCGMKTLTELNNGNRAKNKTRN